jgi:hypothetical protein
MPDGTSIAEVEAVAGNYKKLVQLVGLELLVGLLVQFIPQPLFAWPLLLVLLGLAITMAVITHRLMTGLEAGVPILWSVGTFFPYVNLLVLAAISSRAQRWCRRRGIAVGFLGPTAESIERLRQEAAEG